MVGENFLKGIPGLIDAALQATTAEGLNAVIVKIVATAWLQRDGIGENATCVRQQTSFLVCIYLD